MKRMLLIAVLLGLLMMMLAGCGGSSDGTASDEQSNQGITFNKYSKGSSSTKSDNSIKSTKPSKNNSNQTSTTTDDQTSQQSQDPDPTGTSSENPTDENSQDPGVQNNESGTKTTDQQAESWNDQIDEKNKPGGDPSSLPCRFSGFVMIDGSDAPPDTVVEAYVDSEKVSEWITIGKGYRLDVTGSHPNKMVSIRVNGITATEVPWEKGGNITLDLSIP